MESLRCFLVYRKVCCDAIRALFVNEGKHGGEATHEAVRLIANLVKVHDCQLHPDTIGVHIFSSSTFPLNKLWLFFSFRFLLFYFYNTFIETVYWQECFAPCFSKDLQNFLFSGFPLPGVWRGSWEVWAYWR